MISPVRRLLGGVSITVTLAAAAAIILPVGSAQADVINLSACNLSPLSQPFAPWLDTVAVPRFLLWGRFDLHDVSFS